MDKTKYEKIDGLEALRKIADKVMIYDHGGFGFFYDSNGISYRRRPNGEHKLDVFDISVATVASNEWYIPKPFDVRQAMLDRPNEWVGAYEFSGSWFKVGFDSNHMVAIETGFKNDVPVMYHNEFADHVEAILLNTCIPIEDVPEESKIYGMKPSVAICDEEATR